MEKKSSDEIIDHVLDNAKAYGFLIFGLMGLALVLLLIPPFLDFYNDNDYVNAFGMSIFMAMGGVTFHFGIARFIKERKSQTSSGEIK